MKMINHYSFGMTVGGTAVDFPATMTLHRQYDVFMWNLQQAQKKQLPIDGLYLYYKDIVMATDVETIVKMGAIITTSRVSLKRYGAGDLILECVVNENTPELKTPLPAFHMGFIEISTSESTYRVLPTPILRTNTTKFFADWTMLAVELLREIFGEDHVINPELQEPIKAVDMNWTMEYYVPNELKKAIELIDTNPAESKKILMVIDYMLSSKVKL